MINKHMSLLIVSMLLTSAAQAQEQTDTSTWKYVNDNASPSVIDYKQGNYHKSGKPKKNLSNISGSLDTTMLGQFYGLVPDGVAIDTSLLGSTFNNISVKEDYVGTVSVKVAFLDENAGYSNALGYFIYDTSNPPGEATNIAVKATHEQLAPVKLGDL